LRQILEVAEGVPVAGHEIALAVLDVGNCPEAVDLQLLCGVRRYVVLVIGRWESREYNRVPTPQNFRELMASNIRGF
jgi:hypothetical protein